MKTIKKGTYRFNDVLTKPVTGDFLLIPIDFHTATTYLEDDILYVGVGDKIRVSVSDYGVEVAYHIIAASPDSSNGWLPSGSIVVYFAEPEIVGWSVYFDKGVQTITITEDCEVDNEAYEWFTANTGEQKQIGSTNKKAILTNLIEKLIQRINRRTGKNYTELTSGVKSLIAGYGSGNGDAILYDGLIEINGEPAKDVTDHYQDGYDKGYSEGLEAGGGGGEGSYEEGKAEGRAEAEAEVKPVLLNAIELQDVLLVRPVDENSPLEDVIYEFEDTAIRAKLNVKMYVREPGIESSTYYDNLCIKAVKASAPNFWISSDGIAIEPYFVILSTGTLTVEYASGRILEVFDPTGTLTQDNFINEETGSEVEVHNLYSPSSGESKLSADENGFVWYVSDEECFLCDYIGKERSITLPASCNGREYSFWKKALSGLRVDYIHIPKELKNFSGDAFCLINPFGNDIHIVIDDPGDWCEKSFTTNLAHPTNIGARLYCNGEVIKSINVPEDIITIGKYLLYQNRDIESVIMHDGVKYILNYAFYGCTNLKSITIPDSVATISGYAFASSGLENFVFPKSIRELGGNVLYSCKSLKSLTVYGNKLSSSMCAYCSELTDIIFNDNITTIDGSCFSMCYAITNVTVNGTIKIANDNLRFNNSSRLTVESMVNIMNAFESNVGGTQHTVYFGTANLNKLTAAQKAIATNKNIKLA
jgi:hypothetical protein